MGEEPEGRTPQSYALAAVPIALNEHAVVGIVHTSFVNVESLTQLFRELAPDVTLRHIVDDGLLPEIMRQGRVTALVAQRLSACFEAAERGGCEVILSQCSSVGEAADEAALAVGPPVVKLDERMVEIACRAGQRIGIVATLATTLGPTRRLVAARARTLGLERHIEAQLIEGAFQALQDGDRSRHDALVAKGIRHLAAAVDVVICAQQSMVTALENLGELPIPVLSSPRLGVQHALEVLAGRRLAGP